MLDAAFVETYKPHGLTSFIDIKGMNARDDWMARQIDRMTQQEIKNAYHVAVVGHDHMHDTTSSLRCTLTEHLVVRDFAVNTVYLCNSQEKSDTLAQSLAEKNQEHVRPVIVTAEFCYRSDDMHETNWYLWNRLCDENDSEDMKIDVKRAARHLRNA